MHSKQIIYCVFLFIFSCSSLHSNIVTRTGDQRGLPSSTQFGHPYSGLTTWVAGWCSFSSERLNTPIGPYIAPVMLLFLIFDLPLTVLLDTILFPFELFIDSNSRSTIKDLCTENSTLQIETNIQDKDN